RLSAGNDRYLGVKRDVLETFVDRGPREWLRQATVSPSGWQTPELKPDAPWLLVVRQALACFAYLAGSGRFRITDLRQTVGDGLGRTTKTGTPAPLRDKLGKTRAERSSSGLPGRRRTACPRRDTASPCCSRDCSTGSMPVNRPDPGAGRGRPSPGTAQGQPRGPAAARQRPSPPRRPVA